MSTVTPTVLFGHPQQEIASLITDRIRRSTTTSIVTGFATPGGLAAIAAPLKADPSKLSVFVIGAATYPGFEALDDLIAANVPQSRLYVHLGHSSPVVSKKHSFARYHPMLHSKVYYMEMANGTACAFVGSHNVTSFALAGMNGEAAIMLEGKFDSLDFAHIRSHIETARNQAAPYSPSMKDAYAWWTREFLDGLKAEMRLPQEWVTVRTILLFAQTTGSGSLKAGDHLYFEIPAGIDQIDSLKTETHLFVFDTLPQGPFQALGSLPDAKYSYTCKTLGAENRQGNKEVVAKWRIDDSPRPTLEHVPNSIYRPTTDPGKQQVRAEVDASGVKSYEYLFAREKAIWEPTYSRDEILKPSPKITDTLALVEAKGNNKSIREWSLVRNLVRSEGPAFEKDQAALALASPDSGSFILVSLQRRIKRPSDEEVNL